MQLHSVKQIHDPPATASSFSLTMDDTIPTSGRTAKKERELSLSRVYDALSVPFHRIDTPTGEGRPGASRGGKAVFPRWERGTGLACVPGPGLSASSFETIPPVSDAQDKRFAFVRERKQRPPRSPAIFHKVGLFEQPFVATSTTPLNTCPHDGRSACSMDLNLHSLPTQERHQELALAKSTSLGALRLTHKEMVGVASSAKHFDSLAVGRKQMNVPLQASLGNKQGSLPSLLKTTSDSHTWSMRRGTATRRVLSLAMVF
jgi:hypothetical protein